MQRLISSCRSVFSMAAEGALLTSGGEYQISLSITSNCSACMPLERASAAARQSNSRRLSLWLPCATDVASVLRRASTVSGSSAGRDGVRSNAIISVDRSVDGWELLLGALPQV